MYRDSILVDNEIVRNELATLRNFYRGKELAYSKEIAESSTALESERALREKTERETNVYKNRLSAVFAALRKMGLDINIS